MPKFDNVKFYQFSGKARFARLHPSQRDYNADFGWDKLDGMYEMELVVDESTATEAAGYGIDIKRLKETGEPFMKLRREHMKVHKDGSNTVKGPPLLVDGDNNPIGEDVEIGNGSEVNVSAYVKEYKPGKFSVRLQGVQVVELVEYNRTEKTSSDEPFNPFKKATPTPAAAPVTEETI